MGWLINGQAWDLDAIVAHTREHGGGTFLLGGQPASIGDGYMVGGVTQSAIISPHDSDAQFVSGLRWYISHRSALLEKENRYLGTWRDDAGQIHLDVSQHVADGVQAFALAIQRRELAIWDNANQCEVSCLPAIQALRDLLGNGIGQCECGVCDDCYRRSDGI